MKKSVSVFNIMALVTFAAVIAFSYFICNGLRYKKQTKFNIVGEIEKKKEII